MAYVWTPKGVERYETVDQVKTTLCHMCGAGATYAMIVDALQNIFTGEAGISCGDDRRRHYENAANGMADALAELEEEKAAAARGYRAMEG